MVKSLWNRGENDALLNDIVEYLGTTCSNKYRSNFRFGGRARKNINMYYDTNIRIHSLCEEPLSRRTVVPQIKYNTSDNIRD